MFVAASTTLNNNNTNHPPSYIVAATSPTSGIEPTTTTNNNNTPQTLNDIKLICTQRKKRSKRHIYLTFIESSPLLLSTDQPCIEILHKSNSSSSSSSQSVVYLLNDCISFEYFDTVKNDFQAFIYVYFESYTISIFFSDDNFEKKSLIIKHLEYMHQSKNEKSSEINNNLSQDSTQTQTSTSNLPCSSTTDQILHTFDVNLIPYGSIIDRDHILIGPSRLYFTTTDLYIASINCNRTDLKITITNQCPSKERAILCIPYFTIKNYGNRSNIFLIELGKSNYGNGEIHMKCHSSSLASTIHLLVSPVIEERPLILSSAFQNQLLTTKRIEKSKNIHPPIQLNNDPNNQSIIDSPLSLIKTKILDPTTTINDSSKSTTNSNEMKSHFVVGFFRTLTKNVSHLRRSATFHHNNNHHHHHQQQQQQQQQHHQTNNEQTLLTDNNLLTKNKYVAFNIDDKQLINNDQHQIILPESQKKIDTISISTNSSNITKQTTDTLLTSTSVSTININKQETTMGTYIDMGPTIQKQEQNQKQDIQDNISIKETTTTTATATVEIGVNTTISLSPHVRSAIIVGNSVHLIADDKTLFPIGPRSFTSPASVMQPFKTQLNGQAIINPYANSSDLITSSQNSSSSLHQANSVSNSQQSLLLSYGIVTFNTNDYISSDQTERAISPPSDGSILDRRLNSDISLMSTQQQQQQQGSTIHPLDSVFSSSSSHIFRTLSVSANNIGDTTSGQIRTPHGSIIFFDDLNDQTGTTTTYLLGPPPAINDETLSTNLSRLSSFNLTTSISRPHLSHIDEEKTSTNDPYALIELLSQQNSPQSISLININNSLPISDQSINYVDILLPTHENSELNEQQQTNNSNDLIDENHDFQEQDCETNDLSTKLYTDIDFHQTQRRDRIVQSAAKAKLEDQTPPFVL